MSKKENILKSSLMDDFSNNQSSKNKYTPPTFNTSNEFKNDNQFTSTSSADIGESSYNTLREGIWVSLVLIYFFILLCILFLFPFRTTCLKFYLFNFFEERISSYFS